MSIHEEMFRLASAARTASRRLAALNPRKKNAILQSMADELEASRDAIVAANEADLAATKADGMTPSGLQALLISPARLDDMVRAIRAIAGLKDPIGTRLSRWLRPNGLEILKVRVPIGVIAAIYDARPNVTSDAIALCVKTANAVILRAGHEGRRTHSAIVQALISGGSKKGLPDNAIQLVLEPDLEAVRELVRMDRLIDLVVLRGDEGLSRTVTDVATVPVIRHNRGVCHTYVDASADMDIALRVVENAKCRRPELCNAVETLLVHREVAAEFLPPLAARMQERGVEVRGDEIARGFVQSMLEASENDWSAEYLDRILAVRVVESMQDAIQHVNRYGSRHSDAIIAESESAQKTFADEVDSAVVYINASTGFTDGAEFGMGAEIGISTDKLHARGPMGIDELTTYKYVVHGDGQTRD